MKTFIFCLLAAAIGSAAAWAVNYNRYAHREGVFGPIKMDGEVTAENVAEHVNLLSEDVGLGKIELDQDPTYDFGVMAPGEEGEHVYTVRNIGQGKLKLRVGAATCKCTLGELDKSDLDPGEETEVKLTWKVKTGEPTFGQSAQLLTNDPSNVAITLKITGKVVQDFELVPQEWTFGQVATGDSIEFSGRLFNFMDRKIKPTKLTFTNDEMNNLSEIKVEPINPAQGGPSRTEATQAFEVTAKIDPGLRQGEISQHLKFGFQLLKEENDDDQDAEESAFADEEDPNLYTFIPVKGRIVGLLGMIESNKLKGQTGGGYIYNFGKVGRDDPLTAKAFVVLKGKERENTTLRIGKVTPDGVVKATLGQPKGRGSMALYPLEIELVPGPEPIERLGKDKGDYGSIWIESDNPKVAKMRVVLKFAIEGR